jgi:Spy/CpxP family protein refolding chaperone
MERAGGASGPGGVYVAVCLLAIGLTGTPYAGAQTADPTQGAGTGAARGRGGHGAAMRPGPNGLLGGLMLEQLNLTDAQKGQVKAIVDSHRADVQALIERLGTARRSLESAISADVTDEGAIRARAGDVAAVDADMAVMRAGIRGQVFQILTPDQQTTLKSLEARRISARPATRRSLRP